MTDRNRHGLEPIAPAPQVGLLLAALEDGRRRTKVELATVTEAMVAWEPPVGLNSIGQLLYHVALIEADWVLNEILERSADLWPTWVEREFPIDVRDAAGRLSVMPAEPVERAVNRLDLVRRFLIDEVRPLSEAELHRPRSTSDADVTPSWVLHHLLQHEAEHRAHVALVRDLFVAEAPPSSVER